MENLEYLEKVKKSEEDWLKEIEITNITMNSRGNEGNEYRKVKALEIIAEELINKNSTLRTLITILENIETAIKQRG